MHPMSDSDAPPDQQTAQPTQPAAAASLSTAWTCAGIALALLIFYAILTNPARAIADLAGPSRVALGAAIGAGGVAFWGIFRGITGPAFTKAAVLNAVLLALVAPASIRAWLINSRAADAAKVKTLTAAIRAYADDYAGFAPPSLANIYNRPGISPESFRRPGGGAPVPTAEDLAAAPLDADYLLVAPTTAIDLESGTPILCTRPGALGSWINVGYADGTVRGVRADSVEAATGVAGHEPPPPLPLPTIEELKAKKRDQNKAQQ
jgi:hypothetical protein